MKDIILLGLAFAVGVHVNSANYMSKWFLALNREETCFQWPMNKSLNQKKKESMKQGALTCYGRPNN